MTSADPLSLIGQMVAEKYGIERAVGDGGFSVVYRAHHRIWNQPVAIKFFNGLSSAPVDLRRDLLQSFIQEGKLLTELSSRSTGIVQARDVGSYVTPAGQWMPYMVLEWLDGVSFEDALLREDEQGRPPWSVAETLGFLKRVLPTLDVAHAAGVAHRDIKPANLFVLGEDARDLATQIKLLDFGVAKLVSDNTHMKAALAKTGVGATSFTPQYGAPEQFSRSHGATGPWTDTYALALVAVELLTGRPALEGDDLVQLGFASGNPGKRPTPRTLGLSVSNSLEQMFLRALEVEPDKRFARAKEFLQTVEAVEIDQGRSSAATLALGASEQSELDDLVSSRSHSAAPAPRTEAPTMMEGGLLLKEQAARSRFLAVGAVVLAGAAGAFLYARGESGGVGGDGPRVEPPPLGSAGIAATVGAMAPPPASAASASPASPAPRPTCPDGMAEIPKGQYFQGSDAKAAAANQKPAHNVRLDAFCMDFHEVTAGKYKACSDVGRCKRPHNENVWPGITPKDEKIYRELCTFGVDGRENYPINCVTWEMADLYCKAEGKRLPTESEWEYATRGPDGRIYPWGDEEPSAEHLNACGAECVKWGAERGVPLKALYPAEDGYASVAPVGQFEKGRSRFGPYDVVGNVWEWVSDWYGDYVPAAVSNPTGPATGEKKVIRGGGWNGGYAEWLHPSFRYAQMPDAMSHGVGFRCAKSLESTEKK